MRHIGIVWNPSKARREELEGALPDGFTERITWVETSEEDPGQQATRDALAAGSHVVIAAGGDGTVRAVAEHLAKSDAEVEFGILPMGTGNLFARNLGIPVGNLPAAVERAIHGEATPTDVGWAEITTQRGVSRHAFVVMAGFGIDANMIVETDADLKDSAGWLAYVESLGRAFAASDVVELSMSYDGEEPTRERAHTLLVGNCGTLMGGLAVLPDADPADGELDALVLSADGVAGWADTLKNLVWDNGIMRLVSKEPGAVSSDSADRRRFTRLECTLAEPRQFEVDGDELGEVSRVVVTVQPGALRVR